MLQPDFIAIPPRPAGGKADRLLRAAVSAFCAIRRPSRQEIAQIEDLGIPFVASAGPETLRYVAAALSECDHPPVELVRLLAARPVEISAPLLIRSVALGDVDLIGLIGRHGLAHARAIARRPGLKPEIARLITMLEAAADAEGMTRAKPAPATKIDTAQQKLRAMMRPSPPAQRAGSPALRLRQAALSGIDSALRTALADTLGVLPAQAATILADPTGRQLAQAMKRLALSDEEAFVIACARDGARFARPDQIQAFFELYESCGEAAPARIVPLSA